MKGSTVRVWCCLPLLTRHDRLRPSDIACFSSRHHYSFQVSLISLPYPPTRRPLFACIVLQDKLLEVLGELTTCSFQTALSLKSHNTEKLQFHAAPTPTTHPHSLKVHIYFEQEKADRQSSSPPVENREDSRLALRVLTT